MHQTAINPQPDNDLQLLTAKEVARLLKLSLRTIWTLTDSCELASVRSSERSVRYLASDVRDFILRNRKSN